MIDFLKENSSAVFAIIATIVAAVLSYLFSMKQQKKHINIRRRQEVYLDILSQIDLLRHDNSLVFEKDFIEKIQQAKLKIELYGSKNTAECFNELYSYIIEIYNKYLEEDKKLYDGNKLNDFENVEHEGEIWEKPYFTERDYKQYETEVELYKVKNACDTENLCQLIEKLNCAMRKDLYVSR